MQKINRHILSNGLRIIHQKDESTSMVAVNLMYNVGSRDEDPEKTGFAHLFEHLMFGGSVNIPDFDGPLQLAGAENNAWTSNDFTNYYETIPADNLETAFWLESDRMLCLDFSQDSLDVQKNVVIEEFKQRNLNQPYGDLYMLLRSLAYKVHPYQWSTIGKEIAHIENAKLEDVKAFFFSHYGPNNAVLVVVGNVEFAEVVRLSEKWFGPIPKRDIKLKNIPKEPIQKEARFLDVKRPVPTDVFFKAYHMPHKLHPDYPVYDLISDLLANGNSARLYQSLVQEQKICSEANAFIAGDVDAGLFYLKGKAAEGISLEEIDKAFQKEIEKLIQEPISDYEMEKVKNKYESTQVFSEISYVNKATNLAQYELISKAEDLGLEVKKYRAVTEAQVKAIVKDLFRKENSSTLYYRKQEPEIGNQ